MFTLTVTDASGQQSTTEVSVAVVEGEPYSSSLLYVHCVYCTLEANKPPVAKAGTDKVIMYMQAWCTMYCICMYDCERNTAEIKYRSGSLWYTFCVGKVTPVIYLD